jgi:hypothetical protein
VFDPLIGRFMQADPFVQEPGNLQNYDRYAYCFNNPGTCTDPTGYLFKWIERKVRRELRRSPVFQQVASMAISVASLYFCGPFASLCNGAGQAALAGFSGASSQEAFRAGRRAFWSTEVNAVLGMIDNPFLNAAGHAAWGCAEAKSSGGRCSDGVKGAFAYSALKELGFAPSNKYNLAVNTAIRAASGGLVAELTGGEFWTAARTAAYAYLFNQLSRREPVPLPNPPPEVQDALAVLQPLANQAAANVDATCDWRCSIPFVGDSIRGTLIHSEFERLVKGSPYAGFTTEQSYLDGVPVSRGTPGSSRADVVYGPVVKPIVAFDLKTGFWSTLGYPQAVQYGKNLPNGTYLAVIKPK